MPKESGRKVVATNRKARHDYLILDTYEAGIALMGTEVKSLREGHASMVDGFCTFYNDELWMEGIHIPEYHQGELDQPCRTPPSETSPPPRRAHQDLAQNPGIGLHHCPAAAVLRGRPGEGRNRRRPRQEGIRQAPDAARTAGQARGPARHARTQPPLARRRLSRSPGMFPGGGAL